MCVSAIASVFLLPRLPALVQNAGRAIVGVVVALVVLAVLVGGFYLTVGVDEMDAGAESRAMIQQSKPMTTTVPHRIALLGSMLSSRSSPL